MLALVRSTSAGYVGNQPHFAVIGQMLVGSGTSTIENFRVIPAPQTSSGIGTIETPSGDAIAELRRLSGLSWDQLARVFGVTRRALHFWASGKTMTPSNEEHLQRVLAAVRAVDRGSSSANRTSLLTVHEDGLTAADLLASREYERAISVIGRGSGAPPRLAGRPSSASTRAAREPTRPEELADALDERIHKEKGPPRPSRR
jgi:DNA-binding transcriptional regulator YiaG